MSNGFLFLLIIYAARWLGVEDFGKYSAAFAFVSLFDVLTDLGMRDYFTKEVARDKSKAGSYFSNMVSLKIVLGGCTTITLVLTIFFLGYTEELRIVVYILTAAMILRSFKFTIRAFFKGFGKFEYEAILLFFERILTCFVGILVLWGGYGLIAFVMVFPAVRIIDLFVTLSVFKSQIVQPKITLNISYCKSILIGALPFGLLLGLGGLYSRIDVVMLSMMRPVDEVSWYSAAYRLIDIADMVPAVFSSSIFPALSVLYFSSKKDCIELCNRTVKYLLIIALPVTAYGIMLSERLIVFVFGYEYLHSATVLQILLASLAFSFLALIITITLCSIDKQKKVLVRLSCSIGLNILLNVLLIPDYGYIGAGYATALTQVCNFLILYTCLYREGFRLSLFQVSWKPFLSSFPLVLTVYTLLDYPLLFSLSGGFFSYVVCLLILKTFDRKELRAINISPVSLWKQ